MKKKVSGTILRYTYFNTLNFDRVILSKVFQKLFTIIEKKIFSDIKNAIMEQLTLDSKLPARSMEE